MMVVPWADGKLVVGSKAWWVYLAGKDQVARMETLLTLAMLEPDVEERLVIHREQSLLDAFGIQQDTQRWLREVKIKNITELAVAFMTRSCS
ncbi:MAG: hypothetical protein L0154_07675 [Chloroflexi bacterium]|nr:hypothetical protein [Chloroflexota bacterium]